MAASKSVSRKSAAKKVRKKAGKKAGKTRKSRAAAGKASKTRKQRAAGKKAAATRKGRTAAKKASLPPQPRIHEASPAIAEIDNRMAIIRDNLRGLTEQAASSSGASDEELMSQRIAEQEAKLELLKKQREELVQRGS